MQVGRDLQTGARSARLSVAAACESSRGQPGRAPPLVACSGGVLGASAGSQREKRNHGAGGSDAIPKHGTVGGKAPGGGTKSQAFMKAYFEEKQKNQHYPSPVGRGGRRSGRNRPSLHGASVGLVKTNRAVEYPTGNARTQRGAPLKAGLTVSMAKKSGSSHAVAPPTSSGTKVAQTCNGSAYHSQKPQPHSAVRNNVKCVASEFCTVVAQHKKMKSSASTSHLNGCIARKTQQKLIASTFNTLCSEHPSTKAPGEPHPRPRQSTSKGRKPGPPEIIRPQKPSQSLTPKVAAGKQASLQQLYCQADEESWTTPAALVAGFDDGQEETLAYTMGPKMGQSRAAEVSRERSACDVVEVVERLQARVAELEQQLEEERQDNIEKDIQIQQLQEIVKLKDLQIREYQIEKAMAATMRKQQARTSLLELDRQSSLLKQVRPTTGSCTHDQESRDEAAGVGGRPGRNGEVNRTQPLKDAGCNQSALATTLNLDDGALSAENATADINTNKALVDGCEPDDDIGLQKALVARKEGVESNLQECLTQQNSEKSTKNHPSEAKARLAGGEGGEAERSGHIEDVEELEAVFPEEVPQPTVNIVCATRRRHGEHSDDGRGQLLGEGEQPEDYIQANFFDQQAETIDYSQHCDATGMVPEPQIIDQRDFKPQNRLLQTLQPPHTNSAIQAGSPRGSQESVWHANRSFKVATTKYRSPEEEWQDSKSSMYGSKSAQCPKQAPDPVGHYSSQLRPAKPPPDLPGTPGAVGTVNDAASAPEEVQLEHRPLGAPPGPTGLHGENEQRSVHSLNLSTSAKLQALQEGAKPAGGSSQKSPLSVRGKHAQSWRKSSAVYEPRKASNHLQYQAQSALLLGGRSGRKPQALSVKPQGQCPKGGRTPTNGAQGRGGSYLNHLQKQYASKTSGLNSSAAPSSVGKSLDKVAVNVPSIPARSPGGKRSPGAPEVAEATPETLVHSFRGDGKPKSAEKAPAALGRQSSSTNIQQAQNCRGPASSSMSKVAPAKASQSFVELSKRSPMLPSQNGPDSTAQAGHGGQLPPNSKTKSGQKPPSRREPPLEEPLATQRGASAKGLQGVGREAAGGGGQRGGPARRKASEHHGAAEAKNQTQKLSSRKIGIATPTLSQRGGTSARQSKQSQSTSQANAQSAATQRKLTQPASGHKAAADGQGLTQRLLNSQRISTCRLGQPSSRKQLNQPQGQNLQPSARTKTAITEPIVAHQRSAGSHHLDSSSEKSKQRPRRPKKATRINKNEVLFQQVLRTCRERDESGEGYQESDLVSGAPPCEYSHDSRSRSDRSRLQRSRISLHRSSENSQINLQAHVERERSQYLDRALPRDDAALWGQEDEPTEGLTQQDGADGEGSRRGDSGQALGGQGPTGSAAQSDSTSQCNYRTREEIVLTAQLSSRASGNISCGDGQAVALGAAAGPTSLTILNTQFPTSKGLHQRGDYTLSANYQPQEGAFECTGAPQECGETNPMYDFNLLSPLKQGQDPELLNDSGDQDDADPNAWAQQHSLQLAEHPQPTHREHLPAITCQQSQMFQMSPSSAGALCSPHFHQTQLSGALQPLPPLYALQGSTDFDVIYEKNSTEEMETSILSKSRMSKVSRISRLCPEAQPRPDSQLSAALQEHQLAIRTAAQNTSRLRQGDKATRRHGPTLSGGTALALGVARAAASCDWQEYHQQRTARGRPHLSSGMDFENEGVLGTNYEDSGSAVDGIEETKGSFRKELCDQSLNKEGQKSSQAASSSRAKRVFELRDAIKKDQDNFLMEEILASHTERTPARQRRSRSQRRDEATGPSPRRSSRGKREYCTQAHGSAAVQPFDGNEICNIKTVNRTIPRTGQRAARANKSKLSGCVLGSRAPEKRRGTDVSGGTSEYQTATGPFKVTGSVEGPGHQESPARHGQGDSQGDADRDPSKRDCAHLARSREELETNVQAAQECLEVLDQSLHNFMDEGQAGELPRSVEELRSRDDTAHRHQSSIMEEVTWQGESIRARRASGPVSAPDSKDRAGTVAANGQMRGSGQEKDCSDRRAEGEEEAAEAGSLEDGANEGKANNSQDVVGHKSRRSRRSSPGQRPGVPVGANHVRMGNPGAEENFFNMEKDGFYAYSGAFETFNNVAPGSGPQATEGLHTATLLLQTARSAEGSFVKSDRSPTGFVLSPVSLAAASGNHQHPCQVAMASAIAEGAGGMPGPHHPPNSRASDARSHNVSVLTLQNLPAASSGNTHRSPDGEGEAFLMKKSAAVELMRQMPGVFYQMVSELLGEKLPLIIFTNRHSFKVSLDTMIARYANCQAQIIEHKEILQRELANLQGIEAGPTTPGQSGAEMDRYAIATIPEEDCDPQPSNSQHDSVAADPDAASASAHIQASQCQESVGLPEYTDEQLEGELLEITQVEMVYDGIIENIRRFRRIVE